MPDRPLVVPAWTQDEPLPMPRDGLLVFSLSTPFTRNRDLARQQTRAALCEVLAPLLGCPPQEVPLLSALGQPPRLRGRDSRIGLSVSHEAGLSLVAIHLNGAVGVDLLRVAEIPREDDELLLLSAEYLGTETASMLADLPQNACRQAFARTWVALEAGLKCLGRGLTEWSPERQILLANCRIRELALPEGLIGAVALRIHL